MKINKNRLFLLAGLVSITTGLFLLSHSHPTDKPVTTASGEKSPAIPPTVYQTDNSVTSLPATNPIEKEHEVWMTQAVKQQVEDIAVAYQNNMRFPKYSKPLSKKDWNLLNPRPFIEKKAPLDFNENISASIVLKHYIVHHDQDLPIEVHVSGLNNQNLNIHSVEAYLPKDQNREQTIQLSYASVNDSTVIFGGVLPASVFESHDSTETPVVADITFSDNQQARVSAIFKLVGTDATLTDIGSSYVEGSHLMIPAQFDVLVPGYYRVQANLFDKETDEPVSHINTAFMMSDSDNEGLLKVHAVTLRQQGYAGPYVLKDINITRGPAHPGDKTGYGATAEQSYEIGGHDLEIYDDTEYVDPENQRRLEFLQRMAGIE